MVFVEGFLEAIDVLAAVLFGAADVFVGGHVPDLADAVPACPVNDNTGP